MELFKASKQWATRPQDQRFHSLQEIYDVTKRYADQAIEKESDYSNLRVEAENGDVHLVGKSNIPAKLTHWAFGQLAQRIGAPASYLRDLPATLAVQNLNHGLARFKAEGAEKVAKLLFHQNGSLLLRALTSDQYTRIWNYEVAERLLDIETKGWEPARPDIRVQDDFPALYASDHDLFAFLRTKNREVVEEGSGLPLYRGVIVENSEVGAKALKATRFLYREMCGNHIIWGASQVFDITVVHKGDARAKWGAFIAQVRQWSDETVSDEEEKIAKAKYTMIANDKQGVLDAIFGKRSIGLAKKVIEAGYDATKPEEDGDPNSVWGVVQGITRYSQTVPYADERTKLDRAAGKILDIF